MAIDENTLPKLKPEDALAAQTAADRAAILQGVVNPLASAGMDIATLIPRGLGGAYNTATRLPRMLGVNLPTIPEDSRFFGGNAASMTPFYDKIVRGTELSNQIESFPNFIGVNPVESPPPAFTGITPIPTIPGGAKQELLPYQRGMYGDKYTPPPDRLSIVPGYQSGPDTASSQALFEAQQAAAERGLSGAVFQPVYGASYDSTKKDNPFESRYQGRETYGSGESKPFNRATDVFGGSSDPLADIIQRKWDIQAQQIQDRRADAQAKNALALAQIEMQGRGNAANVAARREQAAAVLARGGMVKPGELELRQAQTAHAAAQAEALRQEQANYAEFLNPATPPTRRTLLGELLKTNRDKYQYYQPQIPGEPGTLLNTGSGAVTFPALNKSPSDSTILEGTLGTDKHGNRAIFKNGAWVPG